MKKKLFKTRLLSFAAFCGLTFAFVSCANEDVAQNPNNTDNDKNLTTFSAGNPSTRTSMESDGKFFWEAGDKIYVKDDNGAWHASSNSPTGKTDNFKFKVPGTSPPTRHTRFTTQVKAVAITKLLSLLLKVKQSQILQLTSVQQAIAVWQQQLKYQENSSSLLPLTIRLHISSSYHARAILFCIIVT